MQYLFRHHHVMPSAFYAMPRGEREILYVLAEGEI